MIELSVKNENNLSDELIPSVVNIPIVLTDSISIDPSIYQGCQSKKSYFNTFTTKAKNALIGLNFLPQIFLKIQQ